MEEIKFSPEDVPDVKIEYNPIEWDDNTDITCDSKYIKPEFHSVCENVKQEYDCGDVNNELVSEHKNINNELVDAILPNDVQNFLNGEFSLLSFAEKVHIKSLGRPMPDLKITHTGKPADARRFKKDVVYNKNKWICGCNKINALFCFPCLLYGVDKIWARIGYKDLKHLNKHINKHEMSPRHMICCTELALLGTANIGGKLDSVSRQSIIKHNEQVDKNRYLLKRIINCIKFCDKLELVSRGDNANEESNDRGIFRELIDFSSELDTILKEHLNNETVFKGNYKTIQNEILDSMLEVCHQEIRQQINAAEFLAIQCDETADISNHCQLVMIVRYLHEGKIQERFWRFFKVAKKTATNLTKCIEHELDPILKNTPHKLIAQTYDIAMSYNTGGVQAKIKQKYENAHFLHCYAHRLSLVMQRAVSQNPEIKVFFSNLSAIPNFFTSSTHRSDLLNKIVKSKLPSIKWNYNIRTATTVFENRDRLIECFLELEDKCDKLITVQEAYGLRKALEDSDFVFWLTFFHKTLPHVDILSKQFQEKDKRSVQFLKDIVVFKEAILLIRNTTEEIQSTVVDEHSGYGNKRRKIDPDCMNCIIAKNVCDIIIVQTKKRFAYRGHLDAAFLLDSQRLINYSETVLTDLINSVVSFYPMLNKEKLKNELEVIYKNEDFKTIADGVNLMPLLKLLIDYNLEETLSEVNKLLKIIVTTPMKTTESERCFSTLKRVKSFLGISLKNERLDALAMMSVNKDLVDNISNFDDKVMEHFISHKDRILDFTYKH